MFRAMCVATATTIISNRVVAGQGVSLSRDRPSPIDRIECGFGMTIPLVGLVKVEEWHIHGNCSLKGGTLVGTREDIIATVFMSRGKFSIEEVELDRVRLSVNGSHVKISKAIWSATGQFGYGIKHNGDGGAIEAVNSGIKISMSEFKMASASNGGAISIKNGRLRIFNVSAGRTLADNMGGMMRLLDADVQVVGLKVNTTIADHGALVHQVNGRFISRDIDVREGRGSDFRGTGLLHFENVNATFRQFVVGSVESFRGAVLYHIGNHVDFRDIDVQVAKSFTDGGVMYISQASAQILNLTVRTAEAFDHGGVCFAVESKLRLRNIIVHDARATHDSGVFMFSDVEAEVVTLTVHRARAGASGGVFFQEFGKLVLSDAIFHNVEAASGGAFCIEEGHAYISKLLINRAKSHVGACLYQELGEVALTNVSVRNVESPGTGGVLSLSQASTMIIDSVVEGSILNGGVAYAQDSNLTMERVTLNKLTRILGIFRDSHVEAVKLFGRCPGGTELIDTSQIWECKPCARNEGVGASGFDRPSRCFQCPAGAEGKGDVGCEALPGAVLNSSAAHPQFEVNATSVADCEKAHLQCDAVQPLCGMTASMAVMNPVTLGCRDGSSCRVAWPTDGYWKPDEGRLPAVKCPFPPACGRTCERVCADGYKGPLCMNCERGWHRQGPRAPCRKCNVSKNNRALVKLLAVLALFVFMGVAACRIAMPFDEFPAFFGRKWEWIDCHTSYMQTKAKVVILTMQTFSLLHKLRAPVPQAVETTSELFGSLDLMVPSLTGLALCQLEMSAYGQYLVVLAELPLIISLVWIISAVRQIGRVGLLLAAYNFTLVGIVKASVSLFLCDTSVMSMTGEAYLMSDYTVICYDAKHYCFLVAAGSVLAAWCGGIPVVLGCRMYGRRHQLNPAPSEQINLSMISGEHCAFAVQMSGEHQEAMHCYGRAMVLESARAAKLPEPSLLEARIVRWPMNLGHSSEDLARLSDTVARSARNEEDVTTLLRQGLRAQAEHLDPGVLAYNRLYSNYRPQFWYYELISIYGRIGYAVVLTLPEKLQALAGLSLSVGLLLSCILRPFRRSSDTYMAAVCYASLGCMFGVFASGMATGTALCNFASVVLMCLPVGAFAVFLLRSYVLPGRTSIWHSEYIRKFFVEEFCRMQLASSSHRREIELSSPPQLVS